MILHLRDNRFDDNGLHFSKHGDAYVSDPNNPEGLGDQTVTKKQRKVLESFGKQTLAELSEHADGAIVDLSGSHLDETERMQLRFFEYHEKDREKEEDAGFRLDTGNLMGVLRFREGDASVQVEVLSRFDKGDGNFFLNYLLSKALDVGIGEDAVTATQSSLLDLLLDALFVKRLGEAAKNGLLRQYRTFRNNDWNFKGRLDLPRHIRENLPLPHGVAYVKREIDLDVPVNRLLLLAAQIVCKRRSDLFERNEDAADAFRELCMAIPCPGNVRSVLSHRDSREPVKHPFYREVWEPLRQIARMILEEERWQLFRESDEEVSGVVFDGSWLWEEYVATILTPIGFRHCVRGEGRGFGLPVFDPGQARFYPDFRLDSANVSERVVLDAKYKRSNLNGNGDDVHQILCYLLLTGAKLGGLVFPPMDDRAETKDDQDQEAYGVDGNKGGWSEPKRIKSPYSSLKRPIWWSCFSWAAIPSEANDWEGFVEYMEKQERELRNWLVATNGAVRNAYFNDIQSKVTLNDLFA